MDHDLVFKQPADRDWNVGDLEAVAWQIRYAGGDDNTPVRLTPRDGISAVLDIADEPEPEPTTSEHWASVLGTLIGIAALALLALCLLGYVLEALF